MDQCKRPRKKKNKSYFTVAAKVKEGARMAARQSAVPLWRDETPVTQFPSGVILEREELFPMEKLILMRINSRGPTFCHHHKDFQKVMGVPGKVASINTVRKYLKMLMDKGYITRHKVGSGEGGYYRYTFRDLKLNPDIKICQGRSTISDSTSLDLNAGVEKPPPVEINSKCLSRAESDVKQMAQVAAQPAGNLLPLPDGSLPNDRKHGQWKRSLNEALLQSSPDKVAKIQEAKQRRIERNKDKKVATKNIDPGKKYAKWKKGKCSQNRAMAWLKTDIGAAIGSRLLKLSKSDAWSPAAARMLFRRWRNDELGLPQVALLEKLMEDTPPLPLRKLIENHIRIKRHNTRQVEEDKKYLASKIKTFREGNTVVVGSAVTAAFRMVKWLVENNELTYENVFEGNEDIVPRFALVHVLNSLNLNDILLKFHSTRDLKLEDEMAANAAVYTMMAKQYLDNPIGCFYDREEVESARRLLKINFQQTCAAYGTNMEDLENYYV